jgi:transposase InsO family protein
VVALGVVDVSTTPRGDHVVFILESCSCWWSWHIIAGRIVHFAVTAHPSAGWPAQQLPEASPWDTAPRYLLRDRDGLFGQAFVDQVKSMGIKQVLSAPRSPWQRAYIERVIGTIRRECLDHVVVFDEMSLLRQFLCSSTITIGPERTWDSRTTINGTFS